MGLSLRTGTRNSGRSELYKLEEEVADDRLISRLKSVNRDLLSVDVGAVSALEIPQLPKTVIPHNLSVPLGDIALREGDPVRVDPSNCNFGLIYFQIFGSSAFFNDSYPQHSSCPYMKWKGLFDIQHGST